jgi:hypothetical protein
MPNEIYLEFDKNHRHWECSYCHEYLFFIGPSYQGYKEPVKWSITITCRNCGRSTEFGS